MASRSILRQTRCGSAMLRGSVSWPRSAGRENLTGLRETLRVKFSRTSLTIALLFAAGALAGCRQDMHDAPRYEAFEASSFFADGRASRSAPAGTVARGWLRADDALYTGKVNGQFV